MDHRPRFYRIGKSLAPVMQGGYGNPFLRTVILGGKAARPETRLLVAVNKRSSRPSS